MKKSTLAIVLMLGAALSASAITTTLEYEDQREAASRSAISNEITAATGSLIPSTTGKHQTSPGCTTDYLASGAVGGPRVIASSANPENDYTAYARMGIAVKRLGGATKYYLYDDSPDGIARMRNVDAAVDGLASTNDLNAKVRRIFSENGRQYITGDGSVVVNRSAWSNEWGNVYLPNAFVDKRWDAEPGITPSLWHNGSGMWLYGFYNSGVTSRGPGGPESDEVKLYSVDGGHYHMTLYRFHPDNAWRTKGTLALKSDVGNYETVSNRAMSALQSHQSLGNYYTKGETDAKIVELAPAPGNYETVSNRAMNAITVAPEVFAANLIKTVMSNSLYNLTYDQTLGVTWRKTAEGGAFYERCYTNVNMIGVLP